MRKILKKCFLAFVLMMSIIAILPMNDVYAYDNGSSLYNTNRYDYRTRRNININFNGGKADLSYKMQIDRNSKSVNEGDWVNNLGIGTLVADAQYNYHYLRAWPDNETPKEGSYWMEIDAIGATPYLCFSNLRKTGYTYAGMTITLSGSSVYKNYKGSQKMPSAGVYAFGVGAYSTGWTMSMKSGSKLTAFLAENPDINFVVQWKANQYTVTYNGNGATGGSTPDSYHTYDVASNLSINSFKAPVGYEFKEWNTNAQGTGTSYSSGQSVKNLTSENGKVITLYAIWQPKSYTVRYDGNGATTGAGSMTPDSVVYGSDYITKQNKFEKNGYKFVGWNESKNGDGKAWNLTSAGVYESGKTWKWTYDHDITLYAQWEALGVSNTITHIAEGFTNGGANYDSNKFKLGDTTFKVNRGEKFDLLGKDYGTINGFEAVSDFKAKDSSGTWKTYTKSTKLTQGDTAYSIEFYYRPITYKITYDLNGAGAVNNSSNPSSYNVLYGVTLSAPTRKGYKFGGWKDQNGNIITGINEHDTANFSSGSNMISELAVRTTGDMTLTAIWTVNKYTVEFDGNAPSSGSMDVMTFSYGEAKALSANKFKKNGNSFVEWNTKKDGSGVSYGDKQVVQDLVDEPNGKIILYAQWSSTTVVKKFTILYDGNGATGGSVNPTNFVDSQALYIASNGFDKTGHKFIGWNTKADGSGSLYQPKDIFEYESDKVDGSSMKLYAQWELNELKVYYDSNGGSINKSGLSLVNGIVHYVQDAVSTVFSFLNNLF